MTIRVKITNAEDATDGHALYVTEYDPLTTTFDVPENVHTIYAGDSKEIFIHDRKWLSLSTKRL